MKDLKSIATILEALSYIVTFLVVLTATVNFQRIRKFSVPLLIYFYVVIVVEAINLVTSRLGVNNFIVFHIFTVFEFILLSLFYANFFKQKNNLVFYVNIFLFLIVAGIDYRINGSKFIDDYSITVEAVVFTIYAVYLYYYVLKNLLFESLTQSPVFWINTGVLVYFAGNLFLFAFSTFVLSNYVMEGVPLWSTMHSTFNILFNLLLGIGIWKAERV